MSLHPTSTTARRRRILSDMRTILTLILVLIGFGAGGQETESLRIRGAARAFFPAEAKDLAPTERGTVIFKTFRVNSEISEIPGHKCRFQVRDLIQNRIYEQFNILNASRQNSIIRPNMGYAAIRILGEGVYCTYISGELQCSDFYDIITWGEGDLLSKIKALDKLEETGCFQ